MSGCGTGNLSFALPAAANVAAVTGIDQAEVILRPRAPRTGDPRFSFQHARRPRVAIPRMLRSIGVYSMLVLQFIPDADHAVAEMCRVVRPGGTVTAAVWDLFGGMSHHAIDVGYRRRARSVRRAAADRVSAR